MGHFRFTATICFCSAFLACGIFTPRDDFEDPQTDQSNSDPYGFSALLDGSVEHFKSEQLKPDWSDLFSDDLKYTIVLSDKKVEYGKTSFLSHLNSQYNLHRNYEVIWKREGVFPSHDMEITLENVNYSILDPRSAQDTLFSGSSSFTIVRQENEWYISEWIDFPLKGSFFTPAE